MRRACFLLAVPLLAVFAPAASAQWIEASVNARADYRDLHLAQSSSGSAHTDTLLQSLVLDQAILLPQGSSTAHAAAFTGPGRLSFSLRGETHLTDSGGGSRAGAHSDVALSYTDRLSFYSASQPLGSLLSIQLRAFITGTRSGILQPFPLLPDRDESGRAEASFDTTVSFFWEVDLPGHESTAFFVAADSADDFGSRHAVFGSTDLRLNLSVRNDPTAFYEMTAEVLARGNTTRRLAGPGVASSRYALDYRAGLAWDGVVAASVAGAAIDDLRISSRSGVDYNHSYFHPIPEPATSAAWAALGLVALCGLRRRSRQSGTSVE